MSEYIDDDEKEVESLDIPTQEVWISLHTSTPTDPTMVDGEVGYTSYKRAPVVVKK